MHWHFLETCDSTNTVARRYLETARPQSNTISDGFIAETQTQGKGTQNRVWVSPPGAGLYMSLLWPQCPLPPELLPFIPLITGMIAIDSLLALLPDLSGQIFLKAVNDLMTLKREKLGGILIEAFSQQHNPTAVVIGLGLNIWHSPTGHASFSNNQPTCLANLLPDWASNIPDKTEWRNRLARSIATKLRENPLISLTPEAAIKETQESIVQAWLERALPGSQISDLFQ